MAFMIMCDQGPQPCMFQVTMMLHRSHYNKQPPPPSHAPNEMELTDANGSNFTVWVATPDLTVISFTLNSGTGSWLLYQRPSYHNNHASMSVRSPPVTMMLHRLLGSLPLTPQSNQDATMATTPLCNVNKMILISDTARRNIALCVAVPNLTALTFPFTRLTVKKGIWARYSQPNFQGARNILHASDSRYYEEEVATTSISTMSVKPLMGEIILYEHRNYNGASLVLTESVPDLRAYGWNNIASSVRVISGKWRLYKGFEYGARGFTATGNLRSLRIPIIRLNDAISSVRYWSSWSLGSANILLLVVLAIIFVRFLIVMRDFYSTELCIQG